MTDQSTETNHEDDVCNCDIEPEDRPCPCEIHDTEAFVAWLSQAAPRVAAARIAEDPLYDLYPLPALAADVPELAKLRAALSEPARELLDESWGLMTQSESWPYANELALSARDSWLDMVQAWERDVLREHLRDATTDQGSVVETGSSFDPCTAEQLLEEADALARLADRTLALERMLRDHAANGSTTADDYL